MNPRIPFLRRAVTASFCVLAVTAASAQTPGTNEFLHVRRGDLPILITAPHGGWLPIADVPKRVGSVGERTGGKFVTSQDTRTYELATATADAVEQLTGRKPFLVALKAHRQFVDANRSVAEGAEHEKTRDVHGAFHEQVRACVDELRVKFPRGALLLDIHGQAAEAETLFRGTQNGRTVTNLLARHGVTALTGPHSVPGFLAANGIHVSPSNTPPGHPPEHRSFNGGFIVRTYGSHTTNGIDAIQLEFGAAFRTNAARRAETARLLAAAIQAHLKAHLLPER
jgi:N-formylglutamate amidohydrolase